MDITLTVRPGPAITREQFVATHAPYSIALDGYVYGEPFLEVTPTGPYRNFNHHEVVDRSCTSATCEQARRAVLLGLYDLFAKDGVRTARLCANDCDQDVCLATWILMNPDRAAEPMVRAISQIEDLLDTSAGTFPMPHDRDLLGEIRWVFGPYNRARSRIVGMSGEEMRGVIDDVHLRIERFLVGRAECTPLMGSFEPMGGGDGWIMARPAGPHARERMISSGVRAAVEVRSRGEGANVPWAYTVWRRSEYVVGFPVRAILRALNEAEGFAPEALDGWGGADNVGGSPRGRGSNLGPGYVEAIVREVVAKARG